MLALESSLDKVVDEVKIVEEGAGETGISGGMLFSLLLLPVFDHCRFSALESWRSSLKENYNINIYYVSVYVCVFLNRNIEHFLTDFYNRGFPTSERLFVPRAGQAQFVIVYTIHS